MRLVLRVKQRETHENFLRVWEDPFRYVSRMETEEYIYSAAEEVRRVKSEVGEAAFCWSGGKDSLALQIVCKEAGVKECVFGMTELEYPAFLEWVTSNMPDGLEVIKIPLNLDWLSKNPPMLFPQGKYGAAWFKLVQHEAQRLYFQKRKFNVLLLGRRRGDGNYCGPKGQRGYKNRQGVMRYCPIADWPHELVMSAIRYMDLDIPPIYTWPRGWRVGTGPWPARQWTNTVADGWREINIIDPTIVKAAAEKIPSAAAFLRTA